MTASENLPITTKQPSDELLNLIEDLKGNLIKTKDLFVIVVNKARDEGFQDKEIDILLHSNLKEIIPKTTLLRYRKEFIPLGVNKRTNVSFDTFTNNIEQSSITSGPNGPLDFGSENDDNNKLVTGTYKQHLEELRYHWEEKNKFYKSI
jgi:hypothetical protein